MQAVKSCNFNNQNTSFAPGTVKEHSHETVKVTVESQSVAMCPVPSMW